MATHLFDSILKTAIADVYDRLDTFVEDPLFTTNLVSIFGKNAATIIPKQFLNFVHHLPKIEIQKASNLQGALGAFSAQTNTIYLSDSLVNSSQSNQLTAVLLEEIGHYLDSRLNKVDTKGDEGELFSAVVRGINLSPTELTRIQNENDQAQIVLDGKLLTVEQAADPLAVKIIGQGGDPKISGNNVTWENGGEIYFWDGSNTMKITNNSINNFGPEISGNNVVWSGRDGNDPEIYFWNGSTVIQLTNNSTSGFSYLISGNNVTWVNFDGNDYEIYFWNGTSATQLTNNSTDDYWPQISGSNVTWVGYQDDLSSVGNIYYWNGNTTAQLTSDFPVSTNNDIPVRISGTNVTWINDNGTDSNQVYLWDGNVVSQLTNSISWKYNLNISDKNVAWDENQDIYVWNGQNIVQMTNTPNEYDYLAEMSGNNVVWRSSYNQGDYGYLIYFWDGVNTTKLTDKPLINYPALDISGNNVIWSDSSDIYFVNFGNENFTTTPQSDVINANDGDDTVTSIFANLQQNDQINGGTGTDTLILSDGTIANNITLNVSNITNQLSGIPGTAIANFERFDLSGFLGKVVFNGWVNDNWIKSGSGNDTLNGNNGNDYLSGGLGSDLLKGNMGNDIYIVDNAGDVVTELLNSGIDTVESSITWTLLANLENLTLTGIGNINGTGNELNNTLIGNTGNNTLNGGLNADKMSGGSGNDTYILDSIRDVVIENLNEGKDLIQSTVNTTLTDNVEDLTLLGTANINGTGNNSDNTITGNSSNNLLKGLNGNDTLLGAAGNDILVGGSGSNLLTGGDGNDQFLFGISTAFKLMDFNSVNFGTNNITDFAQGSDKIILSKAYFNQLITTSGNLQSSEFYRIEEVIGFEGVVKELRLAGSSTAKVVYIPTTGKLFYNPDGAIDGLTGGGQFAYLDNRVSLSATDFLVQA